MAVLWKREWKSQGLTVGNQAATHHGLKILQQCWKGSEGAVGKASSREDSNISDHLSQVLFSSVPNSTWGYWYATVLWTLPLTAGFASSRVHPYSLFAAAVAWFYVMINGNIELKQIIRMPWAITYSFSLKPVWHPAPSISHLVTCVVFFLCVLHPSENSLSSVWHLQGKKGQENVPARTRSSFSGLEMNTTHCHHSPQCVFCIHICIPLYVLLNQPSTENQAKQLVQIHLWINFGPKALIYSNGA